MVGARIAVAVVPVTSCASVALTLHFVLFRFAAARQIDAIVQSVDRIDHGNLRPIARSPAEFTGSPTR